MARIDQIADAVRTQWQNQTAGGSPSGLTADQVAEQLGVLRSEASRDLNQLVKQGILTKSSGRPVQFFWAGNTPAAPESAASAQTAAPAKPFSEIIGAEGSLAQQIQLAKAAAMYPPNGLHICISGESGVGKTLLANSIWKFLQTARKKEVPFVTFNCAEYADNPQLLLSHLFGHEKGAFTGAASAKMGLIEAANGGILFLDEIHRLPMTGQEMLFTVLDKGVFRRLGGTAESPVKLMLIGATTEDPQSTLLLTFKRRIPIMIQLPSLEVRPLIERFDLIRLFFSREAQRLAKPLVLSRAALRSLLSFKSRANVGELENEIRICCAKSYLQHMTNGASAPYIFLSEATLSREILSRSGTQDSVEKFLNRQLPEGDLLIYMDGTVNMIKEQQPHGRTGSVQVQAIPDNDAQGEALFSLSTVSLALSQRIMTGISKASGERYEDNAVSALANCLEQFLTYARAGRSSVTQESKADLQYSGKEYTYLKQLSDELESALGFQLLDGEYAFLALIISRHKAKAEVYPENTEPILCSLIFAVDEKAAAGELASIVNRTFNMRLARGIALPKADDKLSYADFVEEIQKNVQGKEAIILTDSKMLSGLRKRLEKDTKMQLRVIQKTDAFTAMEAGKAILTAIPGTDLSSVERRITRVSGTMQFFGLLTNEK